MQVYNMRGKMAAGFLIMLYIMNFYFQSAGLNVCTGYVCGDGSCVNGTHCDGVVQCADGSDELRCERSRLRDINGAGCISCSHCLGRSGEPGCTPGSYCYCSCRPSSPLRQICSTCIRRCDGKTDCPDGVDEENCSADSTPVGIIIGSSIGGGCLVCCLVAIITIVRIICYAKKPHQHNVTNTTVGTTTLSTAYTAVGQTFNQPGFQQQNRGVNVKSATNSEKEAVISELSLQAPPSYYAGMKSVSCVMK